ncbi:26829_t:CDS:1, partial [Dentiscutata erythropus]
EGGPSDRRGKGWQLWFNITIISIISLYLLLTENNQSNLTQ